MKYALHCESHRSVVSVDGCGVVCSAGWSESLSGGQQRFDGFVSENEQRGDRSQAGGQRLVTACLADAADDLLAAEFLQIIGGMARQLQNLGAVRLRFGKDNAILIPDGKAYSLGGAVREPRDLGIDIYCQSRGLLEYCVRQCTKESANISFRSDCAVRGLIHSNRRVGGVVYDHDGGSYSVMSDFVVDTGGRGSHAPRWIKELGFAPPEETSIGVDFAYASAKYRIPNYSEAERFLFASRRHPIIPMSVSWKKSKATYFI